jgi:hypothetical protein
MFENQLLLEASLEPCWLGQLQKLTAQGRNVEMVTAQGVQKPEKLLWDGLLLAATRLSFSYVCVWMNRCSRWYCIGTCMICICRAYYVRYGLQNAKQANSWLEVIHKQAYIYIYAYGCVTYILIQGSLNYPQPEIASELQRAHDWANDPWHHGCVSLVPFWWRPRGTQNGTAGWCLFQ